MTELHCAGCGKPLTESEIQGWPEVERMFPALEGEPRCEECVDELLDLFEDAAAEDLEEEPTPRHSCLPDCSADCRTCVLVPQDPCDTCPGADCAECEKRILGVE